MRSYSQMDGILETALPLSRVLKGQSSIGNCCAGLTAGLSLV